MLLRSARLHYPVTVTRLYASQGSDIAKASPLFEYNYKSSVEEDDDLGERKTVERSYNADFVAPVDGTVSAWKVAVGTVIEGNSVPLVEIEEPCLHEVQFAGLCAVCGKDMTEVDFASTQRLTDRANINIAHGSTQLLVSQGEASRISDESRRRLLAGRKLSLVVDLDQTIIHATVDPTVAEWQKDPDNPNYGAVKDVRAFQLIDEGPGGRGCWYYIKLRPGLLEFLEEISKYYELHIYTMGTRAYAQNIAKIVDPDRRIFADRIISRDENGSMTVKNLHRLFPVDTKMVVIIDDRGDVWQWSDNLVKVVQYDFFVGIGDINSSFLPKKEALQLEAKTVQAKKEAEKAAAEEKASSEAADSQMAEGEQDGPAEQAKGEEELSAIEQQLVAMAGGDNPRHLEELTEEQDQAISTQLEERPLLKMQEKIDKVLDEEASKTSVNGEGSDESLTEAQKPRHNLLRDDDIELDHLNQALKRVHRVFYDEYDRRLAGSHGGRIAELRGEKATKRRASDDSFAVPDIKDIMPKMKEEALRGVVIVFSGVVPLNVDVQVSDIALWAKSFGAQIENNITSATTHVVATRQRKTHKVKQAASRPNIKIVVVDWLIEAFSTWQRPDEDPFKIEVEPEENGIHAFSDDKDLISALERADEFLSGTDDDDDLETEATATDVDHDADPSGYDDDEEARSPVEDVTRDEWAAMNQEIMAELGSDFDSDDDDSEDNESDASNDSRVSRNSVSSGRNSRHGTTAAAAAAAAAADPSRKRKRSKSSAENSENGDNSSSEERAAALNGEGSNLQRRKKKAFARVSSLTNVATADQDQGRSGLPSPDATGPEEGGAGSGGEDVRNGDRGRDEAGDMDEDDLEAEFEKEFENADDDLDGDDDGGGGGGG